jgi:predicted exporter
MFKLYLKLLLIVNKHRLISVVLLLLLAAACGGMLSQAKFNNDISMMLPEHSEAEKTFQFIAKSGLANKVVISLRMNDDKHSVAELTRYIEQLAKRFDSPLITRVDYRLTANSPLQELIALTPIMPQIFGEVELKQLKQLLESDRSRKLVNRIYRTLTSPMGTGQVELLRSDPLMLKKELLLKLQLFQHIWGYQMAPGQNYFISCDLNEAMLVLDTTVKGTDGKNARALIATINGALKDCPEWITVDLISAHLRALSNEKVIKNDIRFTIILSFIGFLLLFALFFKYDFRCLLLMLVPVIATLYMLGTMTLIFRPLSLFVIALGGVIIGIAIDYGIHLYASMASGRRIRGAASVVKPLIAGGLTTCGVFVVFIFSGTPGYRQLGVFASGSILICLLLAVIVLPALLPKRAFPVTTEYLLERVNRFVRLHPWRFALSWLLLFVGASYCFMQIQFNNNLEQLDGSDPAIGIAEKRFQTAWGITERPAILAITAPEKGDCYQLTETIVTELRNSTGGDFFCVTDILPAPATRQNNIKQWQNFLNSGSLVELEQQLRSTAEAKGFLPEMFDPFFNAIKLGIAKPEQQSLPEMFELLVKRTTGKAGAQAVSFVFFPDQSELVKQVRQLCSSQPGCFVISRNAFRQMLFETVTGRVINLAIIALLAVGLITFLVFRQPIPTFLALLPVASAIIGAGAFFVIFNIPVNAAVCIGAIVIVGLAVDYGIFMVNSLQHKHATHVLAAISLSSLTTLIGAGAVIFAAHPMLRSVGIVLCVGIIIACLTAITVVPAIWRLIGKRTSEIKQPATAIPQSNPEK